MICAYCGAFTCPDQSNDPGQRQQYCDRICRAGAVRKRARRRRAAAWLAAPRDPANGIRAQRHACRRKRRFSTPQAALAAKAEMHGMAGGVYKCRCCPGWHITSHGGPGCYRSLAEIPASLQPST